MRTFDPDSLDHGFPFDCSRLWRPSTLVTKAVDDNNLFRIPDFDLGPLEAPNDIHLDETPFYIPDIPDIPISGASPTEQAERQPDGRPHDSTSPTSRLIDLDQRDLWEPDFPDNDQQDEPRLLTWESFEGRTPDHELQPSYFSEAGPSVFDAALAKGPQRHLPAGVLPQDVLLRAMCALALGRSSIFFFWDAKQDAFAETLRDFPISGYSVQCCGSLKEDLLEHGTLVQHLRNFSTVHKHMGPLLPSITALRRCVDVILDSLEVSLSKQFHNVRSIQQLQNVIDQPRQLLDTLRSLSNCVRGVTTEEQAISAISDRIHVIGESGSIFSALMREILTRVCAPWLANLANDVGLQGSLTTYSTPSGDEVHAQDEAPELPNFIAFDDFAMVREARTSLRILLKYDDTTRSELHQRTTQRLRVSTPSINSAMPKAKHQPDLDQLLLADFNIPFTDVTQADPLIEDNALTSLTEEVLATSISHTSTQLLVEADPYDSWRPAVLDQYKWISHKLLHHLFIDRKLLQHLELQHQFHLFGSAEFISHLSTALFSVDTQTAERRRGVLPTSQTVGLRLGAVNDQAWPPASSELRLTLLGILSDVYYGADHGTSTTQVDLPGGLSFSIRELPDDDIERVMDPTSIYALDFLRLQYVAPAPLDVILTPMIMVRYDEIFRFMLRMIRLLDVTVQLRKQSLKDSAADERLLSIEAQHIVSVLMSHFIGHCINEPWDGFRREMRELEASLCSSSDVHGDAKGMQYLYDQHASCIERLRARLFLKKRQDRIRAAIEAVFSTTLDMNYRKDRPSTEELSTKFRGSVSGLLDLLQEIIDKPAKNRKFSDPSEKESVDSARILYARLNYNDFYRQDL